MITKRLFKYIIPATTLTIGILIAIIGFSLGAKNDYIEQLNLTNLESIILAEGVASLDINVDYADLEITASNDITDFEVSAENISRGYLSYSTTNNILNFKYTTNKWYEIISVPKLMENNGKIKIVVPAEISLQDIQIKSGMGKTTINYLTAENIYIDCGLGKSSINSINAEYVEINNGLGEACVESILSEKLTIAGGAGKINAFNINTEKAEMNIGTGNMNITGIINGDSSIKCGMGNIKAELFGKEKDYSIYVSKGKAKINGKNITEITEGKYNMDIIVGMGDVDINFK